MIERAAASAGFERKAHPRMPRHACGCRNGANGRHSPRRCCRLSGLVGAAFQDESTRRNESARPQPGELRGIVVGSAIDGSPIGTPASDEFFEILHVVYRDLSRGLKHGWALDCPARPKHRSNSRNHLNQPKTGPSVPEPRICETILFLLGQVLA
jgi:hypothetical protein